MKEGVVAHIYKFRLAAFGILTVEHSLHTMALGSCKLYIVLVGESVAEMWNAVNTVFHLSSVCVKEQRRRPLGFTSATVAVANSSIPSDSIESAVALVLTESADANEVPLPQARSMDAHLKIASNTTVMPNI